MILLGLIIAPLVLATVTEPVATAHKVDLSIGAIKIGGRPLNVLIDEHQFVGRILGSPIFSVKKVRLEYLGSNPKMVTSADSSKMQAVTSFLNAAGFYYTHCADNTRCYDLTRTLACNHYSDCPSEPYQDYFVSNKEMLQVFKDNNGTGTPTNVIRGLVKLGATEVNGALIGTALVVRTSSARTGPRLLSRGVDSDGNASNSVELETFVSRERRVCSFVQFRGSIPFFWTQHAAWTKYFAPVEVFEKHNEVSNQEVFDKHIDVLRGLYNAMRIKILSLIEADSDGHEMTLANTLESLAEGSSKKEYFAYTPFSFNSAVSGEKKDVNAKKESWFSPLKETLILHLSKFTVVEKYSVTSNQNAIVRTSCLSSLDRSSAVQRQISDYMAHQMVSSLFGGSVTEMTPAMKRWMAKNWMHAANCIAEQYAGTDAKKNDLIRTGKTSVWGRLKDWTYLTARRHINANYFDYQKRDIMGIVFGNNAVRAK